MPTVAESGFPDFNATNWYAFVAPGKTPPAILDRWNRELVKAMNDPEVKEELLKRGLPRCESEVFDLPVEILKITTD